MPVRRHFTPGLRQPGLQAQHTPGLSADSSSGNLRGRVFHELCLLPLCCWFSHSADIRGERERCWSRPSPAARPCCSSSGTCVAAPALQQQSPAELCTAASQIPLKDCLECVNWSPSCSVCIAVFEGLRPRQLLFGDVFSIQTNIQKGCATDR